MMTPWHALWTGVALACGAVVPGPCTFDPRRDFDCNIGEPCDENFACAVDGFCKSADVACLDGESRCEVPGLDRVGQCVDEGDFASSKEHCGLCFARCLGAGECVDGACVGAPAPGRCLLERGDFDCSESERCERDGAVGEPGEGACIDGDRSFGADVAEPCEDGEDCARGLCAEGLCTRPCDFGCPFGFECDDNDIAGGLCVLARDTVVDGEEICQ